MKSYRKELWFKISGRRGFVNITPKVEEFLQESGIKESLALINAIGFLVKQAVPFMVGGRYAAGTAAA